MPPPGRSRVLTASSAPPWRALRGSGAALHRRVACRSPKSIHAARRRHEFERTNSSAGPPQLTAKSVRALGPPPAGVWRLRRVARLALGCAPERNPALRRPHEGGKAPLHGGGEQRGGTLLQRNEPYSQPRVCRRIFSRRSSWMRGTGGAGLLSTPSRVSSGTLGLRCGGGTTARAFDQGSTLLHRRSLRRLAAVEPRPRLHGRGQWRTHLLSGRSAPSARCHRQPAVRSRLVHHAPGRI